METFDEYLLERYGGIARHWDEETKKSYKNVWDHQQNKIEKYETLLRDIVSLGSDCHFYAWEYFEEDEFYKEIFGD